MSGYSYTFEGTLTVDGEDPFIQSLFSDVLLSDFDTSTGTLSLWKNPAEPQTISPGAHVIEVGNFSAVPEPSTYAVLVASSCFGVLLWRRRHQRR